jgi:hypothetical protein
MSRPKQILYCIVKTVLLMTVTVIVSFYLVFDIIPAIVYRVTQRGEQFDSSIWKSEHPKGVRIQYTQRRRMIHDLGKNYLRIGMHRTEVEELLGSPRGIYGSKRMDYWLGYPPKYLTLDHDILDIVLDDEGKVIEWKVRNT